MWPGRNPSPHRKPVLPDGGMLFLKMARVFPHPGPEGHDGHSEASIRDCGALWSVSGVTYRPGHKLWIKGGAGGVPVVRNTQDKDYPVPPAE